MRGKPKTIVLLADEEALLEAVWSDLGQPVRRGSPDYRSPRETLNKYVVRLATERARQLQAAYKITVKSKD